MLSVSASISLLLTRPAPEHQPSRAELSVQRLSPRSAVLSSALLSACSSGFNECDLDPGTSFLKSSNPKPENSWFCIFLAAWNICIIQIHAAGCLWVHDGQNNFLRLFLVLFFVVTLPGSVGGGLGCGQWTCREPQHPDLGPSAECSQHARQPLLSQHSTTSQLQTTNFQLYKEPFRGWVLYILETWCRYTFKKPISVFS